MENQKTRVYIRCEKDIFKSLGEVLKEDSKEDFKIIKSKKNNVDKPFYLIEFSKEIKTVDEGIEIGMYVENAKKKAFVESTKQNIKHVKENEDDTFRLKVDKKLSPEFYETHKDEFKIVKKIGNNTDFIEYHFDSSDINNRIQLIKRVSKIFDAINTIKTKKRLQKNQSEFLAVAKYLTENCDYMMKTQRSYKKVNGQYLIDNGYANKIDSQRHFVTGLYKYVNKLFPSKRDMRFYYFGEEVLKEETYYVKLRTPEKCNEKINFYEDGELIYGYGEQVFPSFGIQLLQEWQKSIVDMHNTTHGLTNKSKTHLNVVN